MSWNRKSCHWRYVQWAESMDPALDGWKPPTCPMSQSVIDSTPHLLYWCGQLERTKTQKLHWQCHIDLDIALSRNRVIALMKLPPSTHWDISDFPGRSRSYCRKIKSRAYSDGHWEKPFTLSYTKGNAGSECPGREATSVATVSED